MHVKSLQSCLTLRDPVDDSPPGKNTGVGCYALLQGIFPTQVLNPGLPHHRLILNHLSHLSNLPSLHFRANTYLTIWEINSPMWTTNELRMESSKTGVPNFWDLTADDLRWNWCNNNNRNKLHNQCNALESSPNHPTPPICGKTVFKETDPWCQKRWGPLI